MSSDGNGLIYLAVPYLHPDPKVRQRRFEQANRVAAELMRAGVHVFSPISHVHPIAQHGLPIGWDFWEAYDRRFVSVCKAMVVLQLRGWEQSKGVQSEIQIMRSLGRPVFYTALGETRRNLKRALVEGDY